MVRTWHDENNVFDSPRGLKMKLMESFPNEVPDHVTFQVGYYEGRSSTKRWIMESRDLKAMYSALKAGSKINLWWEGKSSSVTNNDDSEPPPKKANRQEQLSVSHLKRK